MEIFFLCADYRALEKTKNRYESPIFIIDPNAIYLCNWISYLAKNSIIAYKTPFSTIPKHFKNCLMKKIRESNSNEIDNMSAIAIEKVFNFLNIHCNLKKIIYLRIYYDM